MSRIWCLACAVAVAACGSYVDRQAAASTYRILLKSREAAQRQVDIELAREAMPGGLLQLDAFALAYPDHRGFRELHADAVCEYAAAFVFDDWEDATLGGRAAEADRLARRLGPLLAACVEANLALLPPAWRVARAAGPEAAMAALSSASRAQVPALLWIASADALALALHPMQHLAELPAITATLARCAELAPGFRDAGAELVLATLIAARSQVLGGDDGGAQFTGARRLAGDGALIADVMFARGAAVARKDRALFEATLRRVIATDVTRWPARRLGNELAVRKARRYLAAEAVLLP